MIDVKNLCVELGNRPIITNIEFSATQGEIVSVIGPNGRGKTTLLRAMAGLLKKTGTVVTEGDISYVPQSGRFTFDFSVFDVVLTGRVRHIGFFGSPTQKDHQAAEEALEILGIRKFKNRSIGTLSGGEEQLVMIARSIASESEIIFLDEPCSALDYSNQDVVLQVIKKVVRERNITVLFTTHSPQHAFHIADKLLLISGGAEFRYGSTAEVMTEKNLTELYGLPMREALFKESGGTVISPQFSEYCSGGSLNRPEKL